MKAKPWWYSLQSSCVFFGPFFLTQGFQWRSTGATVDEVLFWIGLLMTVGMPLLLTYHVKQQDKLIRELRERLGEPTEMDFIEPSSPWDLPLAIIILVVGFTVVFAAFAYVGKIH
jgi:hypothetical protein